MNDINVDYELVLVEIYAIEKAMKKLKTHSQNFYNESIDNLCNEQSNYQKSLINYLEQIESESSNTLLINVDEYCKQVIDALKGFDIIEQKIKKEMRGF